MLFTPLLASKSVLRISNAHQAPLSARNEHELTRELAVQTKKQTALTRDVGLRNAIESNQIIENKSALQHTPLRVAVRVKMGAEWVHSETEVKHFPDSSGYSSLLRIRRLITASIHVKLHIRVRFGLFRARMCLRNGAVGCAGGTVVALWQNVNRKKSTVHVPLCPRCC
jgi:hypothetical protein